MLAHCWEQSSDGEEDLDVSWSFKKWLQREIQSVLKNNIMI